VAQGLVQGGPAFEERAVSGLRHFVAEFLQAPGALRDGKPAISRSPANNVSGNLCPQTKTSPGDTTDAAP